MTIFALILIIWAHWFADFILQTDHQAINKSKDNSVLLQHVWWYNIPITLAGMFLFWDRGVILTVHLAMLFGLINSAMHFVTDYVTSRITGILWKQEKRHWFFVVIGIDQAIHMTCLLSTYQYLLWVWK